MKKISVDVFQQDVLLFGTFAELERYCKKQNINMEEGDPHGLKSMMESAGGMAGVLCYPDGTGCIYIALEDRTLGNLVHECIHAAYFILENAGVPITFDNQESVTYLSQYLFEQSLAKLKLLNDGGRDD